MTAVNSPNVYTLDDEGMPIETKIEIAGAILGGGLNTMLRRSLFVGAAAGAAVAYILAKNHSFVTAVEEGSVAIGDWVEDAVTKYREN